MSSPFSYGSQPSVEGWLEGQYEYMVPDKDIDELTGQPYMPRDAYRDHTPELSDESSSTSKLHRSPRDRYHSSAKERYTPLSPPPEDELGKGRDTYRHGLGQTHHRDRAHETDRGERRPRHDRDTKYPPKAEHGRRRRPPPNTATTPPHLTSGQSITDEDSGKPRHKRYSQTSSPTSHLDNKSSRHHHTRRQENRSPSPPPPRRTSNKDARDRDVRSHHGGSSSSSTKPHRPSLSRSQTAPYDKDTKKSSSSGRSFSFLNDPRFMTAAEAALQAGATAALASGGGKWGKDKGAKVIGAGLSAAALSALKAPAAAGATPPPPPPPPGPAEMAGDKAGRYAAGRREGARRRHH